MPEALLEETAMQLVKDLKSAGFDPVFSPGSYGELFDQLRAIISEQLTSGSSKLMQLLYRVDLEEKKLEHSLRSHSGIEPAEIISRLIVEREYQKAVTRRLHAGGRL